MGPRRNREQGKSMLLIAAFLRATALAIAGYFVWFATGKTEDGHLKTAGKILAGWCAVFAVVLVIAGIASAFLPPRGGFRGPLGPMMRGPMVHGPMMQGGPGAMMPGGMMHGGPDGPGGPGGMMGPRFLFRDRMPPDAAPAPKSETPAPAAPKS